MEVFQPKKEVLSKEGFLGFSHPGKEFRFDRVRLISELLALGHSKITQSIAELVATEVEKEISRCKIEFLSLELVSELVAFQLHELGLVRLKNSPVLHAAQNENNPFPEKDESLNPDLLAVMALQKESVQMAPEKAPLKSVRIVPEFGEEGTQYLLQHVLLANGQNAVRETVQECFLRVARCVAEGEARYQPISVLQEIEDKFYAMMARGEFLPEISVLQNAGKPGSILISSFSFSVDNSIDSVFETMKEAAFVHQNGGMCSFNFSQLYPKENGLSPQGFLNIYHSVTSSFFNKHPVSAAFLPVDHPDIVELVKAVSQKHSTNLRLTVGLQDSFFQELNRDGPWPLVHSQSGKPVKMTKARDLLAVFVDAILSGAKLDFVFMDKFNSLNPVASFGSYQTVGVEGDVPLLHHEAVPCGAINLSKFVLEGQFSWDALAETLFLGIRFMDNILEVASYPRPEFKNTASAFRKISLGLAGFADVFSGLDIPYDSQEAVDLASQIMSFVQRKSQEASVRLASHRGVFQKFTDSWYVHHGLKRRHSLITNLFCTDALASIWGCTPGLEAQVPMASLQGQLALQAAVEEHVEGLVYKKILFDESTKPEDLVFALLQAHRYGLRHLCFAKQETQKWFVRSIKKIVDDQMGFSKEYSYFDVPEDGTY